jgi:hypothetical protein
MRRRLAKRASVPDASLYCAISPCSNTYSALNAVAGHYNNFGTKYPLPVKRAERALKARPRAAPLSAACAPAGRCTRADARRAAAQELSDAELLLERGR